MEKKQGMEDVSPVLVLLLIGLAGLGYWWWRLGDAGRLEWLSAVGYADGYGSVPLDMLPQLEWLVMSRLGKLEGMAMQFLLAGSVGILEGTARRQSVTLSGFGLRLLKTGRVLALTCHPADMARNEAWVSVGRDHDTPAFAVASIRHWWRRMGRRAYPQATALLITADAGGSNGYRCRSWKYELQQLANETGLHIQVSHLPPGTSKWNKIEHGSCLVASIIAPVPLPYEEFHFEAGALTILLGIAAFMLARGLRRVQ